MSYSYTDIRPRLFTEEGTDVLLRVRDRVKTLLTQAGAFREAELSLSGDSWLNMAALDYLVERKEIVRLRDNCWAQYRVYSTLQIANS